MYPRRFVPPGFEVPALRTERFELAPLGLADLVADYEALMATGDRLDGLLLPPGWIGDVTAFTLADDIVELGWHEREFRTQASFAFIARDLVGTRSLGCAYINPTDRVGYDAEVLTWGRWDPAEPDLDPHLFDTVRTWVHTAWPFQRPAFPGREIPWDDWLSLRAQGEAEVSEPTSRAEWTAGAAPRPLTASLDADRPER